MNKFCVCLLLISTLFCCKKEKEEPIKESIINFKDELNSEKKDFITMKVNAIVPLDDEFVLQYTNKEDFKYNSKDKISLKIKGSTEAQNLIFKFPNQYMPTKFMFKVGRKNKENVVINNVQFNNIYGDSFKISKERFFFFFTPNKFISYNRQNATFNSKEVDGRFSPTFISRKILIERLEQNM